jgi:hypothetical protein
VVVEDDDRPLLGLEPSERPIELVPVSDRAGVIADRSIELQRAHLLGPAALLSTQVRAGVHDEAIEPGVEPIGITQRGKLLPRANERLLHRVLSQVR